MAHLSVAGHKTRAFAKAVASLIQNGLERVHLWVGLRHKARALWILRLLIIATVVAVGFWLFGQRTETVFNGRAIHPVRGHLFVVPLKTDDLFVEMANDSNSDPADSKARLYEGRTDLGPPHSQHEDIATLGRGRYSHWQDKLYFSASDNSDPQTNGRSYRLDYRLYPRSWIPALLALLSAIGVVVLRAWRVEEDPLLESLVRAVKYSFRTRAPAVRGAFGRAVILRTVNTAVQFLAVLLAIVITVLLAWRPSLEIRIDKQTIRHEAGHAYIVNLSDAAPFPYRLTGDDEPLAPAPIELQRNGVALGPTHSTNDAVIQQGRGAFFLLHDWLYFSSPDNSDPRADTSVYVLHAPVHLPHFWRAMLLLLAIPATAILALALPNFFNRTISVLGAFKTRGGRIALALVVAGGIGVQMSQNWSEYLITPNLASYLRNPFTERSIRPPVVPVWYSLFSNLHEMSSRERQIVAAGQSNWPVTAVAGDPIIPAIHAQRLLMLASFVALAFALGYLVHPVLACLTVLAVCLGNTARIVDFAVAAILIGSVIEHLRLRLRLDSEQRSRSSKFGLNSTIPEYRDFVSVLGAHLRYLRHAPVSLFGSILSLAATLVLVLSPTSAISFMSEQQNFIHSEPLAMAWLAFFFASMIWVVSKRSGWGIVWCGLFAALSFLTRPAAVFVLVLYIGVVALALYRNWRQFILPAVASLVLVVLLLNSVALYMRTTSRTDIGTASMVYWGPIAFALMLAHPEDEDALPDAKSKRFFRAAMEKKQELANVERNEIAKAGRLGLMLYKVALDTEPGKNWDELNVLFSRTALPLLRRHLADYAAVVGDSLLLATGLHPQGSTTRLVGSVWGWIAIGGLLIFTLFGRLRNQQIGEVALFMLAGHLGHIMVVCMFDEPLGRYVYATELLVVFAAILASISRLKALLVPNKEALASYQAHPRSAELRLSPLTQLVAK